MNLKYPEKLQEAFRSYRRGETLLGSFWIRRKSINWCEKTLKTLLNIHLFDTDLGH
jgi:hypothetical protein